MHMYEYTGTYTSCSACVIVQICNVGECIHLRMRTSQQQVNNCLQGVTKLTGSVDVWAEMRDRGKLDLK